MIAQLQNAIRNFRRRRHEQKRSVARIQKLSPHLKKGGVGAEVGVFEGLFTRFLLDESRPEKLHLIDPWFHLAGTWEWASGKPSTVVAVQRLLASLQQDFEQGRIRLHIDFSTEVIARFEDNYFDWVYIDSSHQYEETVKELALLKTKMKPDGVITGDDWRPDPSHRHYGVCQAVQEFVAATDYSLVLADEPTAQWAIKRQG